MECPYCKAQNRDGVRYCSNCGRPLNPAAAPASAPAAAAGTNTSTSAPTSVHSHSLTPGTTLQGGRYVIQKVLGQGGMGTALLATDKRLDNKSVVIKELVSESTDPEKIKEDERNFRKEVVMLAHLDHPLIPAVTDHFEENSRVFMVQEYVDGEDLEERMNRLKQAMKERDVLLYASEVLDVLDYLSQQTPPIVHRDIKPANIIISNKDKRAHLVDFGIARADVARNVRRKQTSALGTPGYAPPEQYQGNADPRSDLYALGATMHHLLTNRDPRDYPPFNYPPVRTLNPQLSPEVERLVAKAVNNDITQRYQSAAAMKRDVDDILLKRFGISGSISSYLLGTSGPMTAVPGASAASAPAGANQPTQAQQPPPVVSFPAGSAPRGRQAQSYPPPPAYVPPPRRSGSDVGRNFLLFILVILLLGALAFAGVNYLRNRGATASPTPGFGATPATPLPANGLGAINQNGEIIGISDGSVAFDTNRSDGDLKQQAAQKLQANPPDTSSARSLWQSAVARDTNDAEALIYQEDQRVLTAAASGTRYITIVVGTMLTGPDVTVGRDDLQGAYVAQKEYNDGSKLPDGVLVRLLIANSGSQSQYATIVANQIVQAAKADPTIVGVMGWPFSSRALDAIQVLAKAHIPMISQTASSDLLTGVSPYFFRVAPSNKEQGIAAAKYAEQKLHATNVALFVDHADAYSSSLAQDFSAQFRADGFSVFEESYTVGKASSLPPALNDALKHTPAPNLIYFSGYAKDASVLLSDLPATGQFASLPVLGGDALYELGAYQSSARAGGSRLHFTAFAYPDEWDVLGYGNRKPSFFTDYPNYFDPFRQNKGSPYGYTRADADVILSYDAMLAILNASGTIIAGGKQQFTPDDLRLALTRINGAQAIQGVSGQIAFDPKGDPIDKAFVVLYVVDPGGFIHMENSALGTFLKR